jgi:hypothetical protein
MVAQDPQGLRDFVPNIEEGGAPHRTRGAPHEKGPSGEGPLRLSKTVYAETVLSP